MATKTAKPKQKDRENTEERLLLAAEQIFSKFGYNGATTRMIAKKADVNIALINRYFDGKYGLLLKIIERKTIDYDTSELPYPVQKTITEECQAFAESRIDNCVEDLDFFRIVMAQFLTDAKFLKRFQEDLFNLEVASTFEQRVQALIDQKKIVKNISAKEVFETIEHYVFGVIIFKIIFEGKNLEEAKKLVRDFITIYGRGLEP